MDKLKINITKRLSTYIYERFNIFSYSLLIIAMFFSGMVLARSDFSLSFIPILPILFLYFLRLRMYDDIKDYQIDIKLKPYRPLPRGLVTRNEILITTYTLLILEMIIIVYTDIRLIVPYSLVILFSLITFREFFLGRILRKNILLYALPHILLMASIGSFLYYSVTVLSELQFQLSKFILFGFICYIAGLLFEISRKMPNIHENKSSRESFISLLGFKTAWAIFILLFAVSLFTATYLIRIQVLSFIPLIALVFLLLFRRDIFEKLSQKGTELLGALCILYIFIILIIGSLLNG